MNQNSWEKMAVIITCVSLVNRYIIVMLNCAVVSKKTFFFLTFFFSFFTSIRPAILQGLLVFFSTCPHVCRSGWWSKLHYSLFMCSLLCVPYLRRHLLSVRINPVSPSQLWPSSWSGSLNHQFHCLTCYMAFAPSHNFLNQPNRFSHLFSLFCR